MTPARQNVVYLDFDGVLHPDAVYRHREAPYIRLRAPGHEIFESCGVLERALLPYPERCIPQFGVGCEQLSGIKAEASVSEITNPLQPLSKYRQRPKS